MPKKEFYTNIEKKTIQNKNYRKVLYTGIHSQLVLMSLKPGEDIGSEVHDDLDQFIRVEKGNGNAVLGTGKTKRIIPLADGDIVIIPAGTKHNIICNKDSTDLKLYTLYSKSDSSNFEHKDKLIQKTKQSEHKSPKSSKSPKKNK